MFLKLFRFHIAPFLFAFILTSSVVFVIITHLKSTQVTEVIEINGSQIKHRGKYANLLKGDQAEIDLFASIKNPNQLTILGSSELSLSDYASYHFLPDSLGMAAMGFGHAYHQNLSILIELLAAKEYLEGSDICIVLSPGWFITPGTNIEAFIEFARPNLLNKILHDSSISNKYKKYIGRFINDHYSEINGITSTMKGFRNLYLEENENFNLKLALSKELVSKRNNTKSFYSIKITEDTLSKKWTGSFETSKKRIHKEFVSEITSNDIYVNDEYYLKYLLKEVKEDGSFQKRPVNKIDHESSEEYSDFLLVLRLLKERKVNASFILQPFNPYCYTNLVEFEEVMNQIAHDLDTQHFPYLNMYVSNEEDYTPGTLKDVMHLGDYGWMTINEFLVSVYNE